MKLFISDNFLKFVIAILLFSVIIWGCNSRTELKDANTIIEIDPTAARERINISEFADSVKYIKLQTDQNCIIGDIAQLIIKKRYIYVCDVSQMIIFVFDKNGDYVAKLDKRGKGPEEYSGFAGLFVDDNEEYIEVFTRSGELLKYSNITFDFIEKTPLEHISSNYSLKVNDTYYFAAQQNPNLINEKQTNADIIIAKNGKIKTLFEKKIDTNNETYVPHESGLILNDNNELFTSVLYSNTFYKIQDLEAIPILTVDFGDYTIDESLRTKSVQEQKHFRNNTVGKAFMLVLTMNNSQIMTFYYGFSKKKGTISKQEFIILKNRDKTYQTEIIVNDLTSFPTYASFSTVTSNITHQIWHEDYLVNIIIPSNEFIYTPGESKKEIDGLGTIELGDNPIIVLYKLKADL